MQKIIDLHTHSSASDGSLAPKELIRLAKSRGLSAVALTDHDTIDGIEEALEEGTNIGIEVIPGLEISVDFETEMHMLGYFFGRTCLNIKPMLTALKESRERRNPKIIEKLNQLGLDISLEEVEREASGEIVARPHIASVLLKKGYIESFGEAFEKYLAIGRPAYFRKEKLTPEEAVAEILKAGGLPVLAHPIYLKMDIEKLDSLFHRLKSAGLVGVEVYYVDNTEEVTLKHLQLAVKNNLIATGGSDFHGSFKPNIDIGTGRGELHIPYEILEQLKNAYYHKMEHGSPV